MKKIMLAAIALLFVAAMAVPHQMDSVAQPSAAFAGDESNNRKVVIYKNEACGHCEIYLQEFKNFLQLHGYTDIEEKLMINDPAIREEVARLNSERSIPLEMQGHMVTVIDGSLVLEGHVPIQILEGFFEEFSEKPFPQMVVLQDSMLSFAELESYKIMNEKGIRECSIEKGVVDCAGLKGKTVSQEALLPLVLVTGLIDGINPCAFGVLLFFIAFLYSMRKSKLEIWKVGIVFIAMIFITYLGIGLGLLQAILISGEPHLFGKISAVFMLLLALINIKDYFFYGKWFSLRMPAFAAPIIKERMNDLTLFGVAILGFLVGLCTFPCSGGIYIGILSLLAIQTTFAEGITLLLIYNVMFVLPLIAILVVASSRTVTEKITEWEKNNKRKMKLASGLVMLALAAILWFFSN
ncbi:MAG: cytochrome c biogenesis transmembrane protein [archaeon GW2011_AR10]|uniref:Cytochrome C biogenesis protein transmembrane domain-containing protein n=1 Tax=Candidatus Iainarchaeum sp. TaxID=3101447 RepID=A0A7J4ISM5_9ARCH|nr:MAG: cytochrome c biogenesis transmembrane protein [archaeon GW2011_AR10]HIH08462.1 hypothetical protein [Candidatus Diapherotrites archaeon]